MVVVAGSDNERVHLGDIDLQNFEVIRVNAGREAEVEQVATGFQTFAGLDVQCQPPLAFQGPALLCLRKSHAADRETGRLGSPKGDIVRVIGDLPDSDLVNAPAHRSGQERRGQTDQVVCCVSAANRQARPNVAEKYGGPASAACAISLRIFIDPDFLVPSLSRRLPMGPGHSPKSHWGQQVVRCLRAGYRVMSGVCRHQGSVMRAKPSAAAPADAPSSSLPLPCRAETAFRCRTASIEYSPSRRGPERGVSSFRASLWEDCPSIVRLAG